MEIELLRIDEISLTRSSERSSLSLLFKVIFDHFPMSNPNMPDHYLPPFPLISRTRLEIAAKATVILAQSLRKLLP